MLMKNLIQYSKTYGADPELVLAGGGNTSMKENGILTVKASGCSLATVTEENFVRLDMEKLFPIFEKDYPDDDRHREAMFLTDVSAAKLPGQEGRRPSVEALLHALFAQRYVLHLHPALVNGMTCGKDGKQIASELFPAAIWVDACRPGYTLAKLLSDRITPETDTVLLQNHGVFYAAETPEGLKELLEDMLDKLKTRLPGALPEDLDEVDLSKPFTPDHIVYCGIGPTLPDTENARLLYRDAQKINWYSRFFGGPLPLNQELVDFITNWEAESYRKKAASV